VSQPLFIGIDLGTSGCRAMAIDSVGQLQAQASTAMPEPSRDNGKAEQAADIWWQAVRETIKTLLADIPAGSIKALAVDGTSGTLLLADEQGAPLGPALMYNDARSQAEAKRIAAIAPQESAAPATYFAHCDGIASAVLHVVDVGRPTAAGKHT
jgi:sugar (pentulose or hexulose) kinase